MKKALLILAFLSITLQFSNRVEEAKEPSHYIGHFTITPESWKLTENPYEK